MGIRGPAPKPTRLKIINGNPGKRPLNEKEPQPLKTKPKCPSWINKEAKKEWKRIAPELERLGLLTDIDTSALAAYCQAYSHWKDAEEFMTKHGTVFKTPSGYMQQLPHVSIANNAMKIMRAFSAEFGLTPSSRTRIEIDSQDEDSDPMAALLGRRW